MLRYYTYFRDVYPDCGRLAAIKWAIREVYWDHFPSRFHVWRRKNRHLLRNLED